MKKIVFLIGIALTLFISQSQATNLDKLFKHAMNDKQAETVKINRLAMGFVSIFSDCYGVKKVHVCSGLHNSDEYKDLLNTDIDDYELFVSSNEKDEKVRIWIKTKKKKITDMVIISLDTKTQLYDLVKLKGKIDLKDVSNIKY